MTRKKRNHNHPVRNQAEDITMIGESKIVLPNDGSAIEVKLPECIEYFISEDGKLMFQKKQEPANAPENFGITYDEIADKLFLGKKVYFSSSLNVKSILCNNPELAKQEDNARSKAQVLKQIAYSKLLNIATFLNGGWKPNFGDFLDFVYCIGRDEDGNIIPISCYAYNTGQVVFPNKRVCEQAIRIMGEKSLHDLFNYEY